MNEKLIFTIIYATYFSLAAFMTWFSFKNGDYKFSMLFLVLEIFIILSFVMTILALCEGGLK